MNAVRQVELLQLEFLPNSTDQDSRAKIFHSIEYAADNGRNVRARRIGRRLLRSVDIASNLVSIEKEIARLLPIALSNVPLGRVR